MGSRDLGGVNVFSSERDLDAAETTLSCGQERTRMEPPLSGKRDPEVTEIGGVLSSEVDLDAAETVFCGDRERKHIELSASGKRNPEVTGIAFSGERDGNGCTCVEPVLTGDWDPEGTTTESSSDS